MKSRRLIRLLLAYFVVTAALICGLAACGGSSPATRHSVAGAVLQTNTHPADRKSLPLAKRCPHGQAFMGCSAGASPFSFTTAPKGAKLGSLPLASSNAKFPDVSSYQGCSINWAAIPALGAVAKAWEYSQDPCLAHNATSLAAAHKAWTMYDFVRYCTATGFVALYNHYRPPLPPVLDEEVSNAAGCTAPLAAEIHRDSYNHVWPIEYTGPGTEQPGAGADGLPLWIADYGISHPPCLWRCPVGWQFASPPYVYYLIKGLGYGDVSIDMGMLELKPAPPPKPHLLCWGKHAKLKNATCKKVRPLLRRYTSARASSQRALAKAERTLYENHCVKPYRRGICVHAGNAVKVFVQRIGYFAAKAKALFRAYT